MDPNKPILNSSHKFYGQTLNFVEWESTKSIFFVCYMISVVDFVATVNWIQLNVPIDQMLITDLYSLLICGFYFKNFVVNFCFIHLTSLCKMKLFTFIVLQ